MRIVKDLSLDVMREYFVLVDKEGRIRARNDDNGNNIGVYDGTR